MVFINFTKYIFYINFYYDKNKWDLCCLYVGYKFRFKLEYWKTIDHAEKLIDQGCHGTVIFGSTGQAQLISISEKIKLLNKLSDTKYKNTI